MNRKKPEESLVSRGIQLATEANTRAYAPYSQFSVSVALYLEDRAEFVVGVNVENRSYGGTICAERSAFTSAISMYGSIEPGFIVLYTKQDSPTPPCGICLQFMTEFVDEDFPVIMINHKGQRKDLPFRELHPVRFEEF